MAGKEDLSFDEITAFFDKVGAKQPCPICTKWAWTIPEPKGGRNVGLFSPREDGGYVMPEGVVPAILLACQNCGFLRMHSFLKLKTSIRGESLALPEPPPEKTDG